MKIKTKRVTSLFVVMTVLLSFFIMPSNVYAKTYDSQKVVDYALSRVDDSYTSGYCLRFVKECFSHCYEFTSSACCAYTYGTQYKDSTSKTNIPIGADVFFKGVASTCSTCGNKAGHIGIYVGNGYVVHATGGKVQKTKLSTIEGWSGCSYVGWGWHGNKAFATKPTTPTIKSHSDVTATTVTLSWNSVSGATKYKLQYRQAGANWDTDSISKETTNTSLKVSGLKSGKLYWFRLCAGNSAGWSSKSENYGVYTTPKAPTTSTNTTNSIRVNWSGTGGNTKYELLARKSGEDGYKTVANLTNAYTHTVTGLTAGAEYYFKIKAHNLDVTSAVSGRSDSGHGYTKLNAPSVTGKTPNSISLSWNRNAMDGAYTYTYRVCRRVSGTSNFVGVAVVSGKSYTDTGLAPNTSYDYYIDVLRNGVWCVNSDGITVSTNEQLAESVTVSPSSVSLTEGDTYRLSASVLPNSTNNKSVTWTSDNTNVASVSSDGTISAKGQGTAHITARAVNGVSGTSTITVIPKACSHEYANWDITKVATCTENGERKRVCTKCGSTETEVVFATGHQYSDEWTIIKNATCSEYGEKKHLCMTCGVADETTVEIIDMTEHTPGNEWITGKKATCSETGIQYQLCTICGTQCNLTEIPAKAHEFENNWTVEQEATCQHEGIEYCVCKDCNEKQYRYKEKVEHDYALTELKDATTTEQGYAKYTCNHCDNTYTDIIPVIIEKASIIVHSVKAGVGQTVDVAISIHNNPGIASTKLKINYDTNALTLKKVTDAGVLGSTAHSPSLTSPYTLYWNNGSATENFVANGTIATLEFEINEHAEKGTYPISISFTEDDIFNVNMDIVSLDSNDGEIEVTDVILGDLDLDGKVNVKDNMILSRFVAEWPEYNENTVNTAAADLNYDGKINVKDDMILSRHIAEWPGYEILPYVN